MKKLFLYASLILGSNVALGMEAGENQFESENHSDTDSDIEDLVSHKIKQILAQHPEIDKPEFELFEQFENCMKELLLHVEKQ